MLELQVLLPLLVPQGLEKRVFVLAQTLPCSWKSSPDSMGREHGQRTSHFQKYAQVRNGWFASKRPLVMVGDKTVAIDRSRYPQTNQLERPAQDSGFSGWRRIPARGCTSRCKQLWGQISSFEIKLVSVHLTVHTRP